MDDEAELADWARAAYERRPEAWERLYRLTHLPLLRLLRRWIGDAARAEEALQSTYLTAIGQIARFDPARGSIDAWLAGIARRKAQELGRDGRRTATLDHEPLAFADSDVIDGEMVNLALDRLEPRYAEVLRRKYLAGESLRAMAAALALRPATIGTLLHRARAQFREVYVGMLAKAEATG